MALGNPHPLYPLLPFSDRSCTYSSDLLIRGIFRGISGHRGTLEVTVHHVRKSGWDGRKPTPVMPFIGLP